MANSLVDAEKDLYVTVLGLDSSMQSYLIHEWGSAFKNSVLGICDEFQMHKIHLNFMDQRYCLQLTGITGKICIKVDTLAIANAVVLLYDSQNREATLRELSEVWLPRVRDHATKAVTSFLVEVNRPGKRKADEQDGLPRESDVEYVYNSLSGARRDFAVFYASESNATFSEFTIRLLQGC